MRTANIVGAWLMGACLLGCGQQEGHESHGGYESSQPEALSDPELPSQEEVDRKAAEQIDASNADAEYQKLLEEMEKEG
jgi:hypothetical protein